MSNGESQESTQEQDELEVIREAFDTAIDGTDDIDAVADDVKLAMISAGATFKNVTRLYNQFMIDAGFAISVADRKEIVSEILEGIDLDTDELFTAAVDAIVESVKGATAKSAAAMIRAFAKKSETPCYAAPKSENTRNPFVVLFHDGLVENPDMSEDDLRELIGNLNEAHQINPLRWFNQHNNIRKTVNAVAAKFAA